MQTSVAKKLFAVGVAASTVLLGLAPFAASAAVHAEGTNVSKSDGTVGMIIGGQFRPYTSAGAFLSYGFNSWGSVVAANADDLALPTGSFIAPQDGKIFCATATKGTDVKGECSLITGGQKAAFTSAAVFTGLGFSFSRAQYGDSSFLAKTSNVDNSTQAHRAGVLVNNNGTVQLVGATGLLGIPDIATFNSWGYSFSDVVPANGADKAMSQTGVMAARVAGQLSPTALASNGGNGGSVVSGNVTASLSSDTPAANTVVAGQSIADMAHFTFTGTGTVTQVVLKRVGVSQDSTLSSVYLYNGNTRLTDAGSVSNGTVTFNNAAGLFTVSGSMTVSVKSDIATGTSGQTVAMQLAGYTVANGTPATVAVTGNTMTVATASLATVQENATSTVGTTINAGTSNATLWGMTVNVGTRNVSMKYLALKQVGSVPADALQNLQLYVAGSPVGSKTSVVNGQVVFDLNASPVTLQTGNQVIEVRGDVVKGSSLTFSLQLQTTSDIVLVDSNYGVNIAMTQAAGFSFPVTPGTTTVSAGSVSVQSDPSFTATQFVKNASNVTLYQWTAKAYGEDVKVNNVQVKLTYTGTTAATEGFNNLSLYVNGGMVGSSQSAVFGTNPVATSSNATYTFGTTNLFTIPAGTTVTIAVKGDNTLTSGTSITAVEADLIVPSTALQGVTSYNTLSTGTGTYPGTALTVASSSASIAKNGSYGNQTVASNSTNVKIGSYIIKATNAEGVRVTSLTVANGGTLGTTKMANLYVQTPAGKTTPVNPSDSNNFSVDFTVAASQTAIVDVFADISNATGTATTTLSGSGTGASSQTAVPLTATPGQTITVSNGALTAVTFATSTSPVAQFVVGGKTAQSIGTWNIQSTSSPVTITELGFAVATTTDGIVNVTVGGVSAPVVSGSVTVTGLNLTVPAGYSGLNIPVTVDYAPVGLGGITSNSVLRLALNHIKYLTGSQTKTDDTYNLPTPTMTLVSTKPAVTLAASGSNLIGGSVNVGTVTVSADAAGDLKLEDLPLSLTTAGGSTLSGNLVIKDANGNTITTSGGAITAGTSTTATTTVSFGGYTIAAGTSATFNVYATVGGSLGSAGTSSVTMGMGNSALFTWDDINGNTTPTGAAIANFPSNTVSVHN